MSELSTPLLEVEKIDVEEGFNARTHIDEDGLEQLAGSVGAAGIVQPISVRPTEDGRYAVVAGHRRLQAAKRAGLAKVPCVLSQGNAHLTSLIENLHREELDPIDTAKGLRTVAGELNLTTNKEIAEKVGKKVAWVSSLLRLLALPDGVQGYLAAGQVPVEGERVLRPVAAVSPAVAECVCEVAKRNEIKGRAFVERFDELFAAAAEATFKGAPTMISARRFRLSAVITDHKRHEELAARLNAVDPYLKMEDPTVELAESEADAARAAGCLVEHSAERRGFVSSTAFITDREFAADLVERAVERIEKRSAKRAEEDAARRERQAEAGGASPEPEDQKAKRAKAKKAAAKARVFNEELGRNLLKGRTATRRRQQGTARVKAIATVLLADNPQLAGRGLRLTMPALQDVEVKTLKSGEARTKVGYADAEQCSEELLRRIEAAGSEGEAVEVLAEALLAAILADERELPQGKRIRWSPREQRKLEKLLAADVKAVRPRRTHRKEDE